MDMISKIYKLMISTKLILSSSFKHVFYLRKIVKIFDNTEFCWEGLRENI